MKNSIQPHYFSQVKDYIYKDGSISNSELDEVVKHLKLKKYSKGDYILKLGEVENTLSYLVEGNVLQYSIVDSKQVTERMTLSGSAFCSYISYTMQTPSNQIQKALSDVTLLRITKDKIESLVMTCPQLCHILLKKMENIHLQREIRAYILQHKNALERYSLFLKMEPLANEYIQNVSQKYIASYIGLTPQAFSKAKKHLFLRKVIS